MIKLYDSSITDILPEAIKEKPEVIALGYALKMAVRRLMDYCENISIYAAIDILPDHILDALALDLNTQYYDDTFDIEVKRGLIKNTLVWYSTAGTPSTVKELVTAVFGGGEVTEWFEYGADPYWFKVSTDTILTEDIVSYFASMIRRVKNIRSHLGAIEVQRSAELDFYVGVGGLSVYKPAAVIDGYEASAETSQVIYAGTGLMPVYRPAAVIDGYKASAETSQVIYAGTASGMIYRPAAVIDGHRAGGETTQAVYTGTGAAGIYKPAAITEAQQE